METQNINERCKSPGRYLKAIQASQSRTGVEQELYICCDWQLPEGRSFSLTCADGASAYQLPSTRSECIALFEERTP